MKSWKKKIADLPVIGRLSRKAYRRFRRTFPAHGRPEIQQSSKNHLSLPKEPMKGVSLLDGYASCSFPRFAKHLEDALYKVSEDIPLILFPSDRGNRVKIGLKDVDAERFTRYLGETLGVTLYWVGQKNSWNNSTSQNFMSSKKYLKMILTVYDDFDFTLEASLYSENEEYLENRDSRNKTLRHVHAASRKFLEEPGMHRAEKVLGGRAADQHDFPIDAVYTWVNHEDPHWQELYRSAKRQLGDSSHPIPLNPGVGPDAESLARFKSRNELLYSLRSIERFIPWVRRIHILSNCAPPSWLNTSERIVWVYHESAMERKNLPTFNSHAIESHLHKIPNLAEHFIYFNDDFFMNENTPKIRFFSSSGVANANLEDYGVVNGMPMDGDKDYLNAARNGAGLLSKDLGVFPTRLHKHTPYALRRSILEELEEKYPSHFDATRSAKFRSMTDVSVVSFLFHHYAYATGRGTQVGYRSKLIKNTNNDVSSILQNLVAGNGIRAFCINDGLDSHLDDTWNQLIPEFLEKRFPIPLADERTQTDHETENRVPDWRLTAAAEPRAGDRPADDWSKRTGAASGQPLEVDLNALLSNKTLET